MTEDGDFSELSTAAVARKVELPNQGKMFFIKEKLGRDEFEDGDELVLRKDLEDGDSSTTPVDDRKVERPVTSGKDGVEPLKSIEPDAFFYRLEGHDEDFRHVQKSKPQTHGHDVEIVYEEPLFSRSTIQGFIEEKKKELGEKPSAFNGLNQAVWRAKAELLEEFEEVFTEDE